MIWLKDSLYNLSRNLCWKINPNRFKLEHGNYLEGQIASTHFQYQF
jgi:hypothetical protein